MKRILSVLLALVMVISFAACNSTNTGNTDAGSSTDAVADNAADAVNTGAVSSTDGVKVDAADTGMTDVIRGSLLRSDVSGQSDDAVFKVALGNEPANLDLWEARANSYNPVYSNVMEPLFMWDGNEQSLKPCLAESYEWRDDTTLVIKLKKGVKFHSGNEMKAEDVLYTLTAVSQFIGGATRVQWVDFDKSTCEDDYTVVLYCTEHCPSLLINLTSQMCLVKEKAWCEEYGTQDTINGTGSYKFVKWDKGVKLVFERNDDYWNKDNLQCYYKTFESYFYNDMATAFMDFEVGTIDAVQVQNTTDLDNLIAGAYPDAYYVGIDNNGIQLVCMSIQVDERFADIRLRQAISEAIDMDTIVSALCGSMYFKGTSTLPSGSWAYKDESAYLNYNPEHAKQLVEELKAEGMDLTFNAPIEQKDNQMVVAEAMQEMLSAVGITMTIEPTMQQDYMPRMNAGEVAFGFGGGGGGWDPLEAWFPVAPGSGHMLAECQNAEAAALMEKAQNSDDVAERIELYRQIQDILAEGYYYIPVYEVPIWYAFSSKVANVTFGLDHLIVVGTITPAG